MASTLYSTHRSRISSSSFRLNTLPVGLLGVFRMIALVWMLERPRAIPARRRSTRRRRDLRRTQTDEARLGSAQNRVGPVVFVEGLEDHDLVALVADRQQRGDHRLGRAAADDDFFFRIDVDPLPLLHLPGNRIAQTLRAPGDGVLIHVGGDRLLRGPLDLCGRGKIGKSLRQIDGVILHRLPRHLANHRLGKMLNLVGEKVLGMGGNLGHGK